MCLNPKAQRGLLYGIAVLAVTIAGCTPKSDGREFAPIKPAHLEFRWIKEFDDDAWRHEPEYDSRGKETAYEIIKDREGRIVSQQELDRRVFKNERTLVVTGRDLEPTCRAVLGSRGYMLTFSLRGKGRRVFEEFTRGHINKPLAIFIDKKLVSAPTINSVIPGEGVIEGRFTAEQAKTLASQLNAGAGVGR